MTERSEARLYHLTRPDGVGFFRHWSARQAVVGFCGLFLGVAALRLRRAVGIEVAMIVTGAAVMAIGLGRSPSGEALIDIALPFSRFVAKGRTRRRFVAPISLFGGPANGGVPPLFGGLVLHEFDPQSELSRPGPPVGLLEDRADGTVSVVLRVHGSGFVVADADEKDYRVAMWGRALADFCRERHPVSRISWSQWCAPAGIEEHREWLSAAMRDDPHAEMVGAYEQVLERVGRSANRSEGLVTLSVSRARVRVLPHHNGDRLLAAAEKVLDEADMLARQFRRGDLVVSGPLTGPQIARSLRDRLDPSATRFLNARGRSLAEAAGLVSVANAYPLVTEETRTSVRCDGAWHRTFRVAEWPRTTVRADWMRDFLGMVGVVRIFTVIYHPQSRRQSRWEVDSQASRTEGAIDERVEKRHHVGANLRRASSAIEQIDEELEAGAGMEHFTGLVVVTTMSEEELEYATDRVRQGASNVGMELRQLDFRHGAALVAALPLGRGVREGNKS